MTFCYNNYQGVNMNNIYNYRLSELKEYFKEKNEKEFKANQIYEWLYKKRVSSFDLMTYIKKELIEELKKEFNIAKLKIIAKQIDKDVCKYLFELEEKNYI